MSFWISFWMSFWMTILDHLLTDWVFAGLGCSGMSWGGSGWAELGWAGLLVSLSCLLSVPMLPSCCKEYFFQVTPGQKQNGNSNQRMKPNKKTKKSPKNINV